MERAVPRQSLDDDDDDSAISEGFDESESCLIQREAYGGIARSSEGLDLSIGVYLKFLHTERKHILYDRTNDPQEYDQDDILVKVGGSVIVVMTSLSAILYLEVLKLYGVFGSS